jgi:hypothetical protein
MNKIFCFINGGSPGWYNVAALAEDGYCLAGHLSSSEGWAKHDIGIGSDWKHEQYKAHYPDGYELVWLNDDELDINKEFNLAIKKNEELGEEADLPEEERPGVTIIYSE